MTERGRILGITERSCGCMSPPRNRRHNSRRHSMSVRSVGHQSPPMRIPLPNHSGYGVFSASSHGNSPSDWSCSPQSPPTL